MKVRASSWLLAVAILGGLIGWSSLATAHPMFGYVTGGAAIFGGLAFAIAVNIEDMRRD